MSGMSGKNGWNGWQYLFLIGKSTLKFTFAWLTSLRGTDDRRRRRFRLRLPPLTAYRRGEVNVVSSFHRS